MSFVRSARVSPLRVQLKHKPCQARQPLLPPNTAAYPCMAGAQRRPHKHLLPKVLSQPEPKVLSVNLRQRDGIFLQIRNGKPTRTHPLWDSCMATGG